MIYGSDADQTEYVWRNHSNDAESEERSPTLSNVWPLLSFSVGNRVESILSYAFFSRQAPFYVRFLVRAITPVFTEDSHWACAALQKKPLVNQDSTAGFERKF